MPTHTYTRASRVFAAAAMLLGFSAAPLAAQDFIQFQSPTGNIHCLISTYFPPEARCDIIDYTPSFRTAPQGCDLDWGNAFIVEEKGRGLLGCVGDTTIDRSAPKLDYGRYVQAGGFTCLSETTGMTCRNAGGGGFTVSRSSQRLF